MIVRRCKHKGVSWRHRLADLIPGALACVINMNTCAEESYYPAEYAALGSPLFLVRHIVVRPMHKKGCELRGNSPHVPEYKGTNEPLY